MVWGELRQRKDFVFIWKLLTKWKLCRTAQSEKKSAAKKRTRVLRMRAESSARWNLCLKELIFWGSYMRMKFHEVHWLEWKEAELLTVICIALRDRCGRLSQSTGRFSIDWSWEEATGVEIPVGIDVECTARASSVCVAWLDWCQDGVRSFAERRRRTWRSPSSKTSLRILLCWW